MSRVTLASLREENAHLSAELGAMTADNDANKQLALTRRNKVEKLDAEVLRLRLLASEMRGFIMAHHSMEVIGDGEPLYKNLYEGDSDDNKVILPLIKFPFIDAVISPEED